MATKITKKDIFTVAESVFAYFDPDTSFEVEGKGAVTASEVAEALDKEIAQLTKKATAERKPTKAQIESAERRAMILDVLTHEGQTIEDIRGCSEALSVLTGHQVSALLAPMVRDGQVVKTKVKGQTFFALPEAE